MTEYDRLLKATRWCQWMVAPSVAIFKLLPGWIPYAVRALPMRAVGKLFWLHVVFMRYAGYGDA